MKKQNLQKKQLKELLIELGFENKPWKNYNDIWWFDGCPLITLSCLKNASEIIRLCLVSLTPEALIHSPETTENSRHESVMKIINKIHY